MVVKPRYHGSSLAAVSLAMFVSFITFHDQFISSNLGK